MNKFFFAGEIPPGEMMKLLVEEWKLTSHSAAILVDLYGGHIFNAFQALYRLKERRDHFFAFDASLFSNVAKCFQVGVDEIRLVQTLTQLVEQGYAPLEVENDPIAEVLSKYDVAGVVKEAELNVGLPTSVWDDCRFALVPSCQSMRLVMANKLVAHRKKTLITPLQNN